MLSKIKIILINIKEFYTYQLLCHLGMIRTYKYQVGDSSPHTHRESCIAYILVFINSCPVCDCMLTNIMGCNSANQFSGVYR